MLNVGTLIALLQLDQSGFQQGLTSASASLNSFGSYATRAGLALTAGLTAPIVGIGYAAITSAIEFESSFAGVIKTVDGVIDEFGELTTVGAALQQGLRDMAMEIPIGVNELAR